MLLQRTAQEQFKFPSDTITDSQSHQYTLTGYYGTSATFGLVPAGTENGGTGTHNCCRETYLTHLSHTCLTL